MDPNANLREIRTLLAKFRQQDEDGKVYDWHDLAELADYVQALDEWLSKGGFLPDAWVPLPARNRLTPEDEAQMARDRERERQWEEEQ